MCFVADLRKPPTGGENRMTKAPKRSGWGLQTGLEGNFPTVNNKSKTASRETC